MKDNAEAVSNMVPVTTLVRETDIEDDGGNDDVERERCEVSANSALRERDSERWYQIPKMIGVRRRQRSDDRRGSMLPHSIATAPETASIGGSQATRLLLCLGRRTSFPFVLVRRDIAASSD